MMNQVIVRCSMKIKLRFQSTLMQYAHLHLEVDFMQEKKMLLPLA